MRFVTPRRQKIAAAIAAVALLALAYSYFIEPNRLIVAESEIRIKDWHPAFDGLRIAMISDIHGGSNGASALNIRRVVEITNAQQPDVIVLLGDYVSNSRDRTTVAMPMSEIADNLAGLKAKYGVFAVLGNHDGWYGDEEITQQLTRLGYRVLRNEVGFIREGGETVRLLGLKDHLQLDSWGAFDLSVRTALGSTDPRGQVIVLEHSPDILYVLNYWKNIGPDLKLMLAGHTHGGQVWLPVLGTPIVPSTVGQKYSRGHVQEQGLDMYVTSGVGTSILPFRFMVPPEVAVVTVRRAE